MANPETIYHGPYEIRIKRLRPKKVTNDWGKPLNDPLVAATIGYNLTKDEDQEVMYVIGLDASERVLYIQEIYRGTNAKISVRIAELLRAAVIENARRVIVLHNHPAGDPTPSAEDIDTLTKLVEGGKVLGIEIYDYQVVCDDPNKFWSGAVAVAPNLMLGDLSKLDVSNGLIDRDLLRQQMSPSS
jgi:DNA repair protein RadC